VYLIQYKNCVLCWRIIAVPHVVREREREREREKERRSKYNIIKTKEKLHTYLQNLNYVYLRHLKMRYVFTKMNE